MSSIGPRRHEIISFHKIINSLSRKQELKADNFEDLSQTEFGQVMSLLLENSSISISPTSDQLFAALSTFASTVPEDGQFVELAKRKALLCHEMTQGSNTTSIKLLPSPPDIEDKFIIGLCFSSEKIEQVKVILPCQQESLSDCIFPVNLPFVSQDAPICQLAIYSAKVSDYGLFLCGENKANSNIDKLKLMNSIFKDLYPIGNDLNHVVLSSDNIIKKENHYYLISWKSSKPHYTAYKDGGNKIVEIPAFENSIWKIGCAILNYVGLSIPDGKDLLSKIKAPSVCDNSEKENWSHNFLAWYSTYLLSGSYYWKFPKSQAPVIPSRIKRFFELIDKFEKIEKENTDNNKAFQLISVLGFKFHDSLFRAVNDLNNAGIMENSIGFPLAAFCKITPNFLHSDETLRTLIKSIKPQMKSLPSYTIFHKTKRKAVKAWMALATLMDGLTSSLKVTDGETKYLSTIFSAYAVKVFLQQFIYEAFTEQIDDISFFVQNNEEIYNKINSVYLSQFGFYLKLMTAVKTVRG